jgi:hypothetical protein
MNHLTGLRLIKLNLHIDKSLITKHKNNSCQQACLCKAHLLVDIPISFHTNLLKKRSR